jgi:hypothetical protein
MNNKHFIAVDEDNLDEDINIEAYHYYSEGGERSYDYTTTRWEEFISNLSDMGFIEIDRLLYDLLHASPDFKLKGHLIFMSDTPFVYDNPDKDYQYYVHCTEDMRSILGGLS